MYNSRNAIYAYGPNILDNSGNAELNINTNAPFTISWESDVLRRCGRMLCINGIAYRPTVDVAHK